MIILQTISNKCVIKIDDIHHIHFRYYESYKYIYLFESSILFLILVLRILNKIQEIIIDSGTLTSLLAWPTKKNNNPLLGFAAATPNENISIMDGINTIITTWFSVVIFLFFIEKRINRMRYNSRTGTIVIKRIISVKRGSICIGCHMKKEIVPKIKYGIGSNNTWVINVIPVIMK